MIEPTEAEQLALCFLMVEWNIPEEDQDWLTILCSRLVTDMWYVVEIGVKGLPDKWEIQVYDIGKCGPSYTFTSPIAKDKTADLSELPESIAKAIASERSNT